MKVKFRIFSLTAGILTIISISTLAQSVEEKISQAVQPLPEDLRGEASVIEYDNETGERIILREGSNGIECRPRDKSGITTCYPKRMADRRDLSKKLAQEGIKGEKLQIAIENSEKSGIIDPILPGSMVYNLIEKDGKESRLFWIVILPNAKAKDLGLSTESQGMNRPWMMREGTGTAHIMIPVDRDTLSNTN